MLSKSQSKYIRSLQLQKFRKEHKAFIVEGDKIAKEWLESPSHIKYIAALPGWMEENELLVANHPEAERLYISEAELKQVSMLQEPNQVVLAVHLPGIGNQSPASTSWCIALESIRDPGNLGTIMRIADWFGITTIICSPDCADAYNPKVVQSAMGAHLRVTIMETDLAAYIREAGIPAIAAVLDGDNVYNFPRQEKGILIIGNESKGISTELAALARHKVTIPRRGGAESLNAGVSTGILCALLLPN